MTDVSKRFIPSFESDRLVFAPRGMLTMHVCIWTKENSIP
jgi:hypothetical protein